MIKLNKYTVDKEKEFSMWLTDDNSVIEVVRKSELWLNIFVIEDDLNETHVNNFKFVRAGGDISEDEHWFYVGKIGDDFLFQNSSWED